MANPKVIVDFIADTTSLVRGMKQGEGSSAALGQKLKGLAKTGAIAGMAALGAAVKIGVDEFSEASKVTAQTNAVLKSTGGVANVTAKQVSSLSESLMKKSGVDDEAIASGENLLLTFTNIRNEAGKGNDIFNQTTKAALDMSVALGTDMKSAAMQLGKALNDPIKGVTKLQRSGVTFTDAQKEQIKALQESGNMLGAQKIILGEVNREFAGSAAAAGKTLPGQLSILKESFSNVAGELVGRMVPVLLAVAKLLNENRTVVVVLAAVLVTLTATTLAVSAATAAWNAIQVIASSASKAWAAAQWLVNAALAANPIGLVIVAIAALVAAFIIAYKTSDTFRRIVDDAFAAVLGVAKGLWNWLKANWPLLLGILTGPVGLAVALLATHWSSIKSAVSGAFAAVKDTIGDAISWIKTGLSSLASWITGFASGVLSTALNRVRDIFGKIEDGARDALAGVRSAMNSIVSAVEAIVGKVLNAAKSVANAIKEPINHVISGWNNLAFRIPEVKIPKLKIGKKTFGGGGFGGATINFPNIPALAAGGVVTSPTLALLGEAGPEAVVPLDRVGPPHVEVRVFIGDTELTDLVRTEIVDANTGIARALLAGGSA